jgi:hypothetical protein
MVRGSRLRRSYKWHGRALHATVRLSFKTPDTNIWASCFTIIL